jgi:hypothetical protein
MDTNKRAAALLPHQPDSRHFQAYLSNYIAESGNDARLLKMKLLEMGGEAAGGSIKDVFLDVDDMTDLRQEATNVLQSKAFVIMATEHYFTRPYCLLETYWAMGSGMPVVLVDVLDAVKIVPANHTAAPCAPEWPVASFDRGKVQQFLDTLNHTSLEAAHRGAVRTLHENGVGVGELQARLAKGMQWLQMIPFDSRASGAVLARQVNAILTAVGGH